MESSYIPPERILRNYARLLVTFALGQTEGIQPGEVVQVLVPDIAKPLGLHLQNEVLLAGGHPIVRMIPTGFDKSFFTLANQDQLTFFPSAYHRVRTKLIDHTISIIGEVDPLELADIPPEKIIAARDSKKKARDWMVEKETQGRFTWTIALWGVEAKAKLVGLTLEEYWQQIISACFLDTKDPIEEWRKVKSFQEKTKSALNALSIEHLHVVGKDVNLSVRLGADRIWKGGADRNIPSFELFTSPDWRGTEGWIRFNQPVYRYGNKISGVYLEFSKGRVSKATAEVGESLLHSMLKSPNANKLGEFSLTDSRLSRITHPMAETLYDENVGGTYGNMHVAIGSAYRDCYRSDATVLKQRDWDRLGFNSSSEHTDIVSTTNRTVTATLTNGTSQVIYADGRFSL